MKRFTRDGSAELESRLWDLCESVKTRVLQIVRARKLEALVLGGGYGRGEGGVIRTPQGEQPYNDMEFYVFVHGNRLLNVRRYTPALEAAAEALSEKAGLHIEFKVDSIERLRSSSITMFSYDLVTAHKVIFGSEGLFAGCRHHLDSSTIPLSEATRLLLNRCTGLLLAKEMLLQNRPTAEHSDFIARNIAKAQLALGDCILTMRHRYHWSCLERHSRLNSLFEEGFLRFKEVKAHHASGVDFKLHPLRSRESMDILFKRHGDVCSIARELWLHLEGERLQCSFASHEDYASCPALKCNGTPAWINYVLNLRTFGLKAMLDRTAARYPRERLLNALPLLLWSEQAQDADGLRQMLHARSSDWPSMVAAYKEVWPAYG